MGFSAPPKDVDWIRHPTPAKSFETSSDKPRFFWGLPCCVHHHLAVRARNSQPVSFLKGRKTRGAGRLGTILNSTDCFTLHRWRQQSANLSRRNAVDAFTTIALVRMEAKAQFFLNAAEEAADGVGLPARRFPEFLERCAARSLKQPEDLGPFGTQPSCTGFRCARRGFAFKRLGSLLGSVGTAPRSTGFPAGIDGPLFA